MSWKAVEMQVALPRTQEAGRHQEQLSNQSQRFQESLAQTRLRQQLQQRKKTNKFEKTRHRKVTGDDEETAQQNNEQKHETNENRDFKPKLNHPYLGKQIDISR